MVIDINLIIITNLRKTGVRCLYRGIGPKITQSVITAAILMAAKVLACCFIFCLLANIKMLSSKIWIHRRKYIGYAEKAF